MFALQSCLMNGFTQPLLARLHDSAKPRWRTGVRVQSAFGRQPHRRARRRMVQEPAGALRWNR